METKERSGTYSTYIERNSIPVSSSIVSKYQHPGCGCSIDADAADIVMLHAKLAWTLTLISNE